MAFVQIIEFRTSKIDELMALDRSWEQDSAGKRTVRRVITATDRNDPNRHFVFAFFDSYESAMENSNLPETAKAAEQYQALSDGPPTFYDLDIVDDRTL